PSGWSGKARLNPKLRFPTWHLAGAAVRATPREAGDKPNCFCDYGYIGLQLSFLLNLPGTKGSVPDPARSCREKLPCRPCLSL
ncbi:hypothetical protein N333_09710, partial [Nestor notabilis]